MQNCLVLETTLSGLILALQRADGAHFGRSIATPRSSSQLHPLLAELLAEAALMPPEIHVLGVSVGPGSFTGARVAVAVAEAWGLAQPQCRLVGLDTLRVLAKAVVARGNGQQEQGLEKKSESFRVLLDAAGGMAYAQDFDPTGHPMTPASCVPLAEAATNQIPIYAASLPLLEGVTHLRTLSGQVLLAALNDADCHAPLEALYLKPLAYRERTAKI